MKLQKIMVNKIILASKSKVRKKILQENGISCEVEPANVDEDLVKESLIKEGANPSIISKNLAELKANKVSIKKNPKLTCVIGLTTEPKRLMEIRKNRMNSLKESEAIDYTDLDKISKEVEEAKKLFKKYNWPTVDVSRKSVEETAASVIKIYEIAKNNG